MASTMGCAQRKSISATQRAMPSSLNTPRSSHFSQRVLCRSIQIRKAVKEDKEYAGVLSAKPVEELSSYDVFAHYDTDPLAAAVLDRAVQMWGMASANVISLLNPKMVVFGGGIFGPASRFLDRIREEALKWGQPYAVRDASFVVSELPGEAALYGAARLVINA